MSSLVTGAFGCIGDQGDLGPMPPTSLAAGTRQTLAEFTRLQRNGRLDRRELT